MANIKAPPTNLIGRDDRVFGEIFENIHQALIVWRQSWDYDKSMRQNRNTLVVSTSFIDIPDTVLTELQKHFSVVLTVIDLWRNSSRPYAAIMLEMNEADMKKLIPYPWERNEKEV